MDNPKTILITGASSGIGAALAMYYANAGIILHLQGRDAAKLEAVASECRRRGATAHPHIADVTDAGAMGQWLLAADAVAPIDLIIANAGVSAGLGSGSKGENSAQIRRIFATNIDGVVNTVQPLIPAMAARRSGQIAIMSSLAGIRALPGAPGYSSSKACVRYYGEALRGLLARHGIRVNVICPGYIKTPMTSVNDFPMPFIMDADKAARIIADGLARNKGRIAFPLALYIPLWILACLPLWLTDPVFSRLPTKKEATPSS